MKTLIRRHPAVSALLALVVVAALWAAFRPELLFVKHPVDEPFPSASTAISSSR